MQAGTPGPHDLECLHLLLAGAGPQLDAASEESRRTVDGYCHTIGGLLASGRPRGPGCAWAAGAVTEHV